MSKTLVLADNFYHEDMVGTVSKLTLVRHLGLSRNIGRLTYSLDDIHVLPETVPDIRSCCTGTDQHTKCILQS